LCELCYVRLRLFVIVQAWSSPLMGYCALVSAASAISRPARSRRHPGRGHRLATRAGGPVLMPEIKFFGRHRNGMIRDGVIRSVMPIVGRGRYEVSAQIGVGQAHSDGQGSWPGFSW
jgi:hypothetical protein